MAGIIKPISAVGNVAGGFDIPDSPANLSSGGAGGGTGIRVDRGEYAVITVFSFAVVTLQVNIRIFIPASFKRPDAVGGIPQRGTPELDEYQVITKTVVPTSAGAANTFTIPLFKGFVESAYIGVSSGTPGNGDTFVEIGISKTPTRINQFVTLLSGFVTAQNALSSSVANSSNLVGQGALQLWTASGAATASYTQTVPTNTRWRFKFGYLVLTTSAVVGNRRPRLRLHRAAGGTLLFDVPSHFDQAASLVYTYLISPEQITDTAADTITAGSDVIIRIACPEIQATGGDGFSVVFTGNQAGDTGIWRSQFESWTGT